MNLSNLSILGLASDRMQWLSARQKVVDGNTVNLEEQAVKAAEIGDHYRLAAQLYRKSYDMLTMAVTGNR